jgi:glutaredoxin
MVEDNFNNFTVFSKEGCPYCIKIIEVLQLSKQKYVEYKLDRDFDRAGFYHEFGSGSTFPQVVLDGKKLGGCTDAVRYLKENNLV